jgi:uncharacterized protein
MDATVHRLMMRSLETFLGSPRAPKDALSVIGLDGYLTGIVVGPELIRPSEWLPGIWGAEEPVFDSTDEIQGVLNAVMLRYNEIIGLIDKTPERYRPLYLPEAPDPPGTWPEGRTEKAAEWSRGFWKAMLLRAHAWAPMVRDKRVRTVLAPILCFIDVDGHPLMPFHPDETDDLMMDAAELIPQVVVTIRQYWNLAERRARQPQSSRRPGRNEPCPCGSGKKYKRCCGAA